MAYPRTIRNHNVFIDGVGYFGRADEITLPQLKITEADFRGSGMDAPIGIDMGIEKMTAQQTFKEWSPELITHFGRRVRWTARAGAMGQENFDADAWAFEVGGRVVGLPTDALKGGGDVMLKLDWSVDYFRIEKDGVDLVEIDIENGKRVIGGEDQLASMRRAMGI